MEKGEKKSPCRGKEVHGFPRTGEWTFLGEKTQCLDPKDSVFAPRTLSLLGEKSERGRMDCGMGSSGRVIIQDNELNCAVFGALGRFTCAPQGL